MPLPIAVFIAGTDTGIGKTTFATALLRAAVDEGQRAVGMKPVAAGVDHDAHGHTDGNADVLALAAAGNVEAPLSERNPYCLDQPMAPHVAAARVGVTLSLARIGESFAALAARADVVVVEGAGGVLVPLDDRHDMLDIALTLALPVILVVGIRLGCLNHALLSELAIRCRGVALAGWVANGFEPAADPALVAANIATLKQRIAAPLLARMSWEMPAPDLRGVLDKVRCMRTSNLTGFYVHPKF